jgi:hypothetical protein
VPIWGHLIGFKLVVVFTYLKYAHTFFVLCTKADVDATQYTPFGSDPKRFHWGYAVTTWHQKLRQGAPLRERGNLVKQVRIFIQKECSPQRGQGEKGEMAQCPQGGTGRAFCQSHFYSRWMNWKCETLSCLAWNWKEHCCCFSKEHVWNDFLVLHSRVWMVSPTDASN